MNNKRILSILVLIIAFSGSVSFAQNINIGIGGGITTVTAPNFYSTNLSDGYNIGLKLKLNVPLSPITPFGYLNYSRLSKVKNDGLQDIKYSQSIFSIGVGGEFSILPIPGPLSPYVFADIAYNNFGNIKIDPGLPQYDGSGNATSSISRYGLGLGIGTEINLIVLKFDLNAKYNMYNLVGKSNGEDTISSVIVNLYLMF